MLAKMMARRPSQNTKQPGAPALGGDKGAVEIRARNHAVPPPSPWAHGTRRGYGTETAAAAQTKLYELRKAAREAVAIARLGPKRLHKQKTAQSRVATKTMLTDERPLAFTNTIRHY